MGDYKDIDQLAGQLLSDMGTVDAIDSKIQTVSQDSDENSIKKTKKIKKVKKDKKPRCDHPGCKKKLRIMYDLPCKCKKLFCKKHKDAEIHNCTYDHQGEYRKKLEKENPLVMFSKVDKIVNIDSLKSEEEKKKEKKQTKSKKVGIMDFMKFL